MLADIYGKSREQKWAAMYKDTHMSAPKISMKYNVCVQNVREMMCAPDKVYPHGNHTALYLNERVKVVFEDGEVLCKS